MPQGRIILKSICQSKKMPKLKTDGARLLYTWLLTNLDINGCFWGDARIVKSLVFTRLNHSIKTIESYLEDLDDNHLVVRYETDGELYIFVPDFVEKQPKLRADREAIPTIPLPTQEQLGSKSGATHSISKVKESKDKGKRYLDFVFLADREHEKLNVRYGKETTDRYIASLNNYIGSKGRKYKSHYYTILVWLRRDGIQEIKRKAEQKKEYKIPKEEERSPETEKKVKNMIKQIKIKKVEDA